MCVVALGASRTHCTTVVERVPKVVDHEEHNDASAPSITERATV